MEIGEFIVLVEAAVAARETVIAFVQCQITYSGRAEAFLGRGDRVLFIKADQAVILHQPEGGNPINYMRPGSTVSFERVEGHAMLHVMHAADKSFLDVEIFRIYDVASRKLEDGQKQDLSGSEADMSDHIRDHPELISNDFRPISREEQTDVGFIDVFGHDKNGRLIVVECKRVTASLMAVDQLRRYVDRVKQIKGTESVSGVLAAPAITPNARDMLEKYGFSFAHVHPPKRLERWHRDQKKIGEF
jgi:RecB family endonuclease NucS